MGKIVISANIVTIGCPNAKNDVGLLFHIITKCIKDPNVITEYTTLERKYRSIFLGTVGQEKDFFC
jgi:hypothetical protein